MASKVGLKFPGRLSVEHTDNVIFCVPQMWAKLGANDEFLDSTKGFFPRGLFPLQGPILGETSEEI